MTTSGDPQKPKNKGGRPKGSKDPHTREREARRLIEDGADVIVPTGGIPMMLFGETPDANVDGAPIVNGVTVLVKAAEMAVKLSRLTGHVASRAPHSGYVLPSAQALDEFLQHG